MTRQGFTNQQRQVATEDDLHRPWGGFRDGSRFRCHLCGHRFKPGDGWRWIYSGGVSIEYEGKSRGVHNPMVCDDCDGPDVVERWKAHVMDYLTRFWSFVRPE